MNANFLYGIESPHNSTSQIRAVKQTRPDEKSWGLWRRGLKLFATKRKLHNPLGDWLYSHRDLQRNWVYYYDYAHDILYQQRNEITYRHDRSQDGRRRHSRMDIVEDVLPENVVPAAVHLHPTTIQVTNWRPVKANPPRPSALETNEVINTDTMPT